ncbi:putative MFS transporter, AGZA family, xanthine/uracil permease [Thermanaeromonas toyohensis ToBE]|uniref:Putative MFS transporter, AGZA family, xanthine/uracil permease n=1 Tax=Thermanaeromonas toyohensis ToBE TaxID=698762 RepID=A0A1W1W377_9FIRM|nr:NCS2 family permease [Thermanaeromonas toyohensis]SMC00078.1 putative MFS transporter, AGZA family, xanthine/uracil permease [Thermanaeromonas toyohensis ToBE]
MSGYEGFLERTFKLKENNTTIRTEVLAGFTTFMTMAYIIFVNPAILSTTGMNFGAVLVATILASAVGTLIMAFLANYPIAIAPGMGLNAFFAFTIVKQMGYPWEAALAAVFMSGVIFIILTLTKAREAIVNSIPLSLKLAISAGIGLFIALIGLQSAGIVVSNPDTLVKLGNLHQPSVLLAIVGLIITSALVALRIKGALLLGILITTLLGIPLGITKVEGLKILSLPPSLSPTLGAFTRGLGNLLAAGIIPVIFTLTFVDLFDTLGTLIGVSSKAGLLDEKGHLPRAGQALMSDAIATTVGAILGTSTCVAYIESASGVAEGGRTGLTSLVVALLFLASLFFSPLVGMVPAVATAPVLIIVGIFMMEPIMKIDFTNFLEAAPAFLTMAIMPFTYDIAQGIVWGVLAYVFLHLITGQAKKVSLTMWILAVLFLIRFFV